MEEEQLDSWEKDFVKEFHDYHMDDPDDVLLDGVTSGRVRGFIRSTIQSAVDREREEVVREIELMKKNKDECGCNPPYDGGGCGCSVHDFNQAISDVLSLLKSIGKR